MPDQRADSPRVPPAIACMECGGQAKLLMAPDADDWLEAGDIFSYRCPDCWERFDMVLEAEDIDPGFDARGS